MTGGEITGNWAPQGCGVYFAGGGNGEGTDNTFTMIGGKISYNRVSEVAIGYQLSGATLNNIVSKSAGRGGGVYVESGAFNMSGGSIDKNMSRESETPGTGRAISENNGALALLPQSEY
jgi:hypothetical protein